MVFTVDYRNNLKGNDLEVPVHKYTNHDDVPDIDYNHMNSSTVSNERKYDTSYYNNSNPDVLIIKKIYPKCDKTRSKNIDLSIRNTGVLSKLKNRQEKPDDNYICMEETEIQDTYYLRAVPIIKSSGNLLKPATFTGEISDVPNRENPVHKNIGIQLIKKN
jgi:hypothetical protein